MDKLIIEPLQKAIHQLEIGLKASVAHPENDLFRDAAIQRFEYTYELSCKMLKRYLERVSESPSLINTMSFSELIRTGWEQELLKSSWNAWNVYRNARNQTSQVYNEKKAKEVYAIIPDFLEEACYLYTQLRDRLQQSC